jgi:hypothetical protein
MNSKWEILENGASVNMPSGTPLAAQKTQVSAGSEMDTETIETANQNSLPQSPISSGRKSTVQKSEGTSIYRGSAHFLKAMSYIFIAFYLAP